MRLKTLLLTCLFLTSIFYVQGQYLVPEVQKPAHFDVSKPLTEMTPLDNSPVKTWKDGIVKNKFRYKISSNNDKKIV